MDKKKRIVLLLLSCWVTLPANTNANSNRQSDIEFEHNDQNAISYIVVLDASRNLSDVHALLNQQLNRQLAVHAQFTRLFTGFVTNMTQSEAELLRREPSVVAIFEDEEIPLFKSEHLPVDHHLQDSQLYRSAGSAWAGDALIDPVVNLMGADGLWDGSATGDDGHMGEGIVVGLVGPGVISAHPAIAATGDDGYTHVNPLGDGTYLGDCFSTPDYVCNSKIIGRYNFSSDPAVVSDQLEGYGIGLVSQAVGNRMSGETTADFGLPLVTGVAPHANLIVYRSCGSFTCAVSATLQAFEQAMIDDVDILLHPLGSSFQSPWDNVKSLAALSLRAQGIMISQATGNSGPDPGSLSFAMAAPWNAVFATSSHARNPNTKALSDFSGGDTTPPDALLGGSLSGTYSGNIVYAGNVPNPNSSGESALCLQSYPAGTFSGEILVCDRGEISLVQKSLNALDSGAGGFVLANVSGGTDSIVSIPYALPSIHINAADANQLRTWLASGNNHTASIQLAPIEFDPALADVIRSQNSRGPAFGMDYLMPSTAVPASNVLVASSPALFATTSGPASAPGAGVLALLESARPDWTDAERLSALMSTGVAPLLEEDRVTMTTPFDHGGGRINLAAAVQTGLVLDESVTNFAAANPSIGGNPKDLNLAGLIDLSCLDMCTWTREIRAVVAGTWNSAFEMQSDMIEISVTPASFTLDANQLQTLTITLRTNGAAEDTYHGSVLFTPTDANVTTTRWQLSVGVLADDDLDGIANINDNCLELANESQRDSDSDGYGNRCDTDLNNDGVTNFLDVAEFSLAFQGNSENADFNGDGKVDFLDFEVLSSFFLLPPGPSGIN